MFLFKKWRRKRIKQREFPREWLTIIEQRVPFYSKLPVLDKEELKQHILVFLAEKRFFGCGGLTITDEIKVTIAAQACVLLLHRETDYYPGLNSILVYPAAYIAKETRHLAGGVVEEGYDVRLGESWRHGAVVLSWDDIRRDSADIHDGHNVVFHEFASVGQLRGTRRQLNGIAAAINVYHVGEGASSELPEITEGFVRRTCDAIRFIRGSGPGGIFRGSDGVFFREAKGFAENVSRFVSRAE